MRNDLFLFFYLSLQLQSVPLIVLRLQERHISVNDVPLSYTPTSMELIVSQQNLVLKFLFGKIFLDRCVSVRIEGFVELVTDVPVHPGAFSNIPNGPVPGSSPRQAQIL